jgi:hypothetical protein
MSYYQQITREPEIQGRIRSSPERSRALPPPHHTTLLTATKMVSNFIFKSPVIGNPARDTYNTTQSTTVIDS